MSPPTMQDYYDMCQRAAESAEILAKARARQGLPVRLYLYVVPSTATENGEIHLVEESDVRFLSETAELHCAEPLRGNIPYIRFYDWIRDRTSRAPVFATGVAS